MTGNGSYFFERKTVLMLSLGYLCLLASHRRAPLKSGTSQSSLACLTQRPCPVYANTATTKLRIQNANVALTATRPELFSGGVSVELEEEDDGDEDAAFGWS